MLVELAVLLPLLAVIIFTVVTHSEVGASLCLCLTMVEAALMVILINLLSKGKT
ncbi:MAG TPA: hypothetical protein VLX61_06000 [Anaerolineales bacterium]|nr:hypothetical protein [Anaerolineales bacterium]